MDRKEAYEILTNPNTTIYDFTENAVNKQWKEAYDIAVKNLKERCEIGTTNSNIK